MSNPTDDSINLSALHLSFSYAMHLFNTGDRQQKLLDIMVGCHKFDELYSILKENEKICLLSMLMVVSIDCDKYSEIIKYGNQLLTLPIEMERKPEFYFTIGCAYNKLHEYTKAIDYPEMALEICKQIGNHDVQFEAMVCGFLGKIYSTVGELQKAQSHLERSLQIFRDLGDIENEGRSCSDLAKLYNFTGEKKKAVDYCEKALKISRDLGDKKGEGTACLNLSAFYISEFEKAKAYSERGLEISKDIGDNEMEAILYSNLGHAYGFIGDHKKALDYQKKSLNIVRKLGDVWAEFEIYHSLGLSYLSIGQYDNQCRYICQAISVHSRLRKDVRNRDQFNMSMAKQNYISYKSLMLSLLNLKHIKKAMLVLDVGRSQSLFDLLRLSSSAINEDLLERQVEWIEKIPSMINDPKKDSHADISENVCRSLKNTMVLLFGFELGDLYIWVLTQDETFLRKWSPRHSKAKDFFENLLAGLRGAMVPRRSHLGLDDRRDHSWERKTEIFYKLPVEIEKASSKVAQASKNLLPEEERNDFRRTENVDELENFGRENENARETASRGDSQQADMQVTRRLIGAYQALIASVEDLLTGSNLIIVPDDSLFLLPFSALLDPDRKNLCDRYSIQITPALHTLNFSLSIPVKPLGPALCVGNPAVGEVSFQDKIVNVPPLPGAEVEATECAIYFEAKPLLNEQATKKKVLERMKNASVVHIAAHGNWNYGELFLAPNPEAPSPPKEEHYLLTPDDITVNSLSARLVVLSCCHSGQGEISSEGVAGTARAFLGAGARAVLVALWALPDKETRAFMELFYENVCKGLSVCVALQQTMITFKERNNRIQAWAPFEIIGEDVTLTSEDLEEIRRLSREHKE